MKKEHTLGDWESLIHHISVEAEEEIVHHCYMYEHIGNLYEQEHLVIDEKGNAFLNGKKVKPNTVFHVLISLEPTQDISWSEKQAEENNIKPKRMKMGMKYKEKAKEW